MRVAHGDSGAKSPLLAARPKLAGWVAVFSWFIETHWQAGFWLHQLVYVGGVYVPERPCTTF